MVVSDNPVWLGLELQFLGCRIETSSHFTSAILRQGLMAIPSEWLWHEPWECREQTETCGGREAFLRVELGTTRKEHEGQSRQEVLARKRITIRSMLGFGPALPGNRRQQLMAGGVAGEATPPSTLLPLTHPTLTLLNPGWSSGPAQPLQ